MWLRRVHLPSWGNSRSAVVQEWLTGCHLLGTSLRKMSWRFCCCLRAHPLCNSRRFELFVWAHVYKELYWKYRFRVLFSRWFIWWHSTIHLCSMYNTLKDGLGPITSSDPMTSSEGIGFLIKGSLLGFADNWVMDERLKANPASQKEREGFNAFIPFDMKTNK